MTRARRHRGLLAGTLLSSVLLATTAADAARRGTVTLKFPNAVAPKSQRHVTIVAADTIEVLDSLSVGRKRQVVLGPDPGVLFTTTSEVGLRRARSAVSRVFRVDPRRAATATLRLQRLTVGPSVRATGTTGGPVITMGNVPVTIQGTSQTGSLGAALLTGAFDATHDAGARWVSSDQKVLEMRAKELDLQAQGRLDPSTPIIDAPLEATLRIEGELSYADGRLTGELRIVDLKTGEVIDTTKIDRDFDRDSQDDLDQLLRDLVDAIIRAILSEVSTTTTTTSSSTTTTSTTALSTTTSTTSLPSTTVTTTPTTSTTSTTIVVCGSGLLASAEVYRALHAGVSASAPSQFQSQSFNFGPISVPLGEAGGTDTKTWDLPAAAGGASAVSQGTVRYDVSGCELTASGTFHEASTGGSDTASASTGLDARLQIAFKVKQLTPFTITGSVRAVADASTAPETSAYLKCTGHFGEANANLQAPTGAPVPFDEQSILYPTDEYTILCAVIRGGSSTGAFGDDEGDLEWSFTVTLGS